MSLKIDDDPMQYAHAAGMAELAAAKAKAAAFSAERLYRRYRNVVLLQVKGASAAERQAAAATDAKVIALEDVWITAQAEMEVALAKRDAFRLKWETWRTSESSRRAEMRLT